MSYHLQTIVFLRNQWSLKQAEDYLKLHGYKSDVDIKAHSYRFRQIEPKHGKKYDEYKTLIKHINGKVIYHTFQVY